jgi:hypothetical protein
MMFDIRVTDGPRIEIGGTARDLTPAQGLAVAEELARASYRASYRALAREELSAAITAEVDRALGKDTP